jgi:GTP-binding protein
LVYLLDCASEDIKTDLKILKAELKQWNPDLLKRPSIVVLSKIDLLEGSPPKGPWKHKISSATQEGIEELIAKLWKLLESAPFPSMFREPEELPAAPGATDDDESWD